MGDLFSDIGGVVGGALGGPLGAGLAMGGLNLLGGIFQQDAAASQVQQQEGFQERMSDTQYQRGAADLRAAGINPLLFYGADAAMPGAMYQPENVLGSAVGSAVQAGQGLAGIQTQGVQQDLMRAQQDLAGSQSGLYQEQVDQVEAQVKQMAAQTQAINLSNAQTKILTDFYVHHPDLLKSQSVFQQLLGPLLHAGAGVAGAAAQF